jgi:hypothetical protein
VSGRNAGRLIRTFQVLRVALARSPMARIRAWARLPFFCQAESSVGSGVV